MCGVSTGIPQYMLLSVKKRAFPASERGIMFQSLNFDGHHNSMIAIFVDRGETKLFFFKSVRVVAFIQHHMVQASGLTHVQENTVIG